MNKSNEYGCRFVYEQIVFVVTRQTVVVDGIYDLPAMRQTPNSIEHYYLLYPSNELCACIGHANIQFDCQSN